MLKALKVIAGDHNNNFTLIAALFDREAVVLWFLSLVGKLIRRANQPVLNLEVFCLVKQKHTVGKKKSYLCATCPSTFKVILFDHDDFPHLSQISSCAKVRFWNINNRKCFLTPCFCFTKLQGWGLTGRFRNALLVNFPTSNKEHFPMKSTAHSGRG